MTMTWKRFLSLLLALTMILSLGVTGFADDGETEEEETAAEIEESDEELPEETILETEPISPDKLNIRKVGVEELTEDEELALQEEEDLNEVVRVSIFLDKPSTLAAGFAADGVGTNSAAIAYRDGLKSDQQQITAEIERVIGHPLDVKWNITLGANAISAYVTKGEMLEIAKIPGVKSVERENQYLPMEDVDTANTSENMVGAWEAWSNGYTGAGSRIAIIDTGIDTTHQSFAEEPFTYSVGLAGATSELMTKNEVQGLAGQLNSRSGNYVSAKIPYGYNYVDGNTTIDHTHDTEGNHGSHVAGIAAANRYVTSSHSDAIEAVGAVGMAPDAQLLIMKVFGSGGGAYDSDYFVAIEDAIILGADACNLSLGSGAPGWTFDNQYQGLLNNWANGSHNGKMVLTISAGNAGAATSYFATRAPYVEDAYTHTGGSPGSFVNSLCVAAAQNTITTGAPLKFNNESIFYAESTSGESGEYTNPEIKTIAGNYELVYIDSIGEVSDYSTVNSAASLSGKIVIVNRGSLAFSEKGNNAISFSPAALIIANNSDGVIHMDLSDYTGSFPMVSITLKDAQTIKAGCTERTAGGIKYYTGRITVTDVEETVIIERPEATITDFSSWGVPGSLLMKPEITAPGGDIWSVYGTANTSGGGTEGGSDAYVSYSGTSMAAPHMAGLTAVLAERFREDDIFSLNAGLSGYSARAIIQSLLMSTATPMAPEGQYLSILQQGAGLADVGLATAANSVVMMDPGRSYLTGLTGAAADGKVKVELGDDPDRAGDYQFGFTVYNLTDDDLYFDVETEIFTQSTDGEFLLSGTWVLPAGTSFLWEGDNPVTEGHDVNRDGVTDINDAQAILDYLSGVNEGENLDLEAGDLDGDGVLSTYDAYLLLGWEGDEEEPNAGMVPAHGSRYCSVRITLSPDLKEYLDAEYPGGAFLEGFTYITSTGSTKDGGVYKDEHSIPILGYYGSWTDATMFETTSYVEDLYGSEQLPYSGKTNTNYLKIQQNGSNVIFTGNPYMVEDSFPADRLAINSNTAMVSIGYNLIRSAGTTGFAVSTLDEDGLVDEVLSASVAGNEVTGLWYYVNQGSWQNTTTKLYTIGKTPGDYGLAEGDVFRVGFYAIPEYNGMVENEDYTSEEAGLLSGAGFKSVLESNVLGKGAFVGYDFVVDDTAPQIGLATLSNNTLRVAATDDRALAYVAVLSLDGQTVYAQVAPGVDEYEISLDASDAIANAQGYVAVFAGDYAGNETAVAVKVNDNTHVEKTVYVQTNTVTAGEDYLIVNSASTGVGYALNYTLNASQTTATVAANALTINSGTADTNNKVYIDSKDVSETAVWTAGSGSSSGTYTFNNNGWYLRTSNRNNLTITKDSSRRDWTWNGSNNRLSYNSYYLRYYNNTFSINTTTNSVYLYQKTVISYEVDPNNVSSVTITPNELDIYKGSTAELSAKVLPLTAADRTVTWSSSNPSVATVDEFGKVTGIAAGTANIRATANGDPTKFAECPVTVTAINKNLNAVIWDEEGAVYFSSFNANNLPTWTKQHTNPVGTYLASAFMFNSSSLYAGTLDSSTASTTLYSVNRSTYALTEFGENFVGAFGMARSMTGWQSYGYNFIVYGFANYLIFGNLDPDDDGEGGMYSGLPYGLLDITETCGDVYVCGVAARNVAAQQAGYYFLDETGKIWQTTLTYNSNAGEDESAFQFSTPTLVVDTGIGTGFFYQSLYYDGTYLYWSHQADNISELIIIVPSTGKIYHAGDFGEGVWPAAGLYVNGSAAPASVGDETMGAPIRLQRVAGIEDLLTPAVLARFASYGVDLSARLPGWAEEDEEPVEDELPVDEEPVEDEEPVGEPEPAEEPEPAAEPAPVEDDGDSAYLGGLNYFRGAVPSIGTVDPEQIPDGEYNQDDPVQNVEIEIAEDEDSHNGLFAITYDPETITFTGYEVNEDISIVSVFVDEDKSVITVAYANVADTGGELPITDIRGGLSDYILAGDPIVTLYFTVNCEKSLVDVNTLERNEEIELNEEATLDIGGMGHSWGEPAWDWAEDYTSATMTLTCSVCGEVFTEEAEISVETVLPGCETAGSITYTATVEFEDETYTDVQTVETEPAGHIWGEPSWTWTETEDGFSAEAFFVCTVNGEHTRTLTAEVGSEEVEEGILYTATVTLDGETYTDTHLVVFLTIILDAGDGTVEPAQIRVAPGEAIGELPTPELEGWKFLGWFEAPAETLLVAGQGTAVTAETTFAEGTTIYAHWRLPGDINGDGTVSNKDVTRLQRYLKYHNVDVVEFNLDVNGDGGVSNKDLTRLQRFIKHHDVEIN